MSVFAASLNRALSDNNTLAIPRDEGINQEKIIAFLELLLKWNKVYNLTNITNPREMVYLHIIDSLLVQPYLTGETFLDIGTGAGLPGIPLAIANPHQHWTLLDKNSKKTRFLTQVTAELMLRNVQVIHSRTEDFHPAQGFDTIVSRAYSSIRLFAETTAHLLNPHGMLIAMKGQHPQAELRDLPAGFQVQDIVSLKMVGMDVERHIVRIRR